MPFFKLNDVFAGRYLLVELMGSGNSLEVWKAKDSLADDAEIVIKIYTPAKGLTDADARQFSREYSLSQHISHPHLLKVSYFDLAEGFAYLIMPFHPKGSLRNLLEREASFSERQAALLLSQIGSALDELHRQGPPILHQHVNPDNIVIARHDHFLLADFGISPLISEGDAQPQVSASSNSVRGASVRGAYAPPENFDEFQESDASGDVFSLGLTLFELCTKKLPWGGEGGRALLAGGVVPNLPETYSAELNELLQSCISADREKRPSAGELHLKGKHFLETGYWDLAEKEDGVGSRLKRIVPYILAAAVFALVVVGVFWEFKYEHLADPTEDRRKMATSAGQEDPEVDQMLLEMLELEREDLSRRTLELEKKNQQLMRNDSIYRILLRDKDVEIKQFVGQLANKEEAKVQVVEKKKNVASNTAAAPVVAPPKRETSGFSPKDIEQQLNKISDPQLSGKARNAWKEETMAQFAEGAVRILDVTEGKPKQYSTGIFVNLLYKVPHTIEVKEVKRDENKKVTELRLTMRSKM